MSDIGVQLLGVAGRYRCQRVGLALEITLNALIAEPVDIQIGRAVVGQADRHLHRLRVGVRRDLPAQFAGIATRR